MNYPKVRSINDKCVSDFVSNMKSKFFVLMALLCLTGCSSTHSKLVYKINCKTDKKFLDRQVHNADLEFASANDYFVCEGFRRYKIVRNNISIEYLDGRRIEASKVEKYFYANYNYSKCEITIVTPLTGKVSDLSETNHILRKYFYAPLLKKLAPPGIEKDISEMGFDSEGKFKEYCQKNLSTHLSKNDF